MRAKNWKMTSFWGQPPLKKNLFPPHDGGGDTPKFWSPPPHVAQHRFRPSFLPPPIMGGDREKKSHHGFGQCWKNPPPPPQWGGEHHLCLTICKVFECCQRCCRKSCLHNFKCACRFYANFYCVLVKNTFRPFISADFFSRFIFFWRGRGSNCFSSIFVFMMDFGECLLNNC